MKTNKPNKWSRKGFEVHISKDGESWYRYMGHENSHKRPMFTENELSVAQAAFAKAAKEHKHTTLVKLEMNFELIQSTTTAETEQERMAKLLARVKELLKDMPAATCVEQSSIAFGQGDIQMSPSYIMVEVVTGKLSCGPCPRRKDFQKGPDGKAAFDVAIKGWEHEARPLHNAVAMNVGKRLHDAGIKTQTRTYNGFNAFRIV